MLRLISGALVLALTVPAFADAPSYSLVNGNFQSVELDTGGVDVDGDGFGFSGSYAVADNWHIGGGYSSVGFDFGIDLNRLAFGGGYHTNISENTSFFADLSWVNWEVDTGALLGSVDDDGYGFSIGVRSNVTENVELAGNVTLVDFGDGGDSTSIGGAAWYHFESFAIGVTADFDEDFNSYGIGGRFYFDE